MAIGLVVAFGLLAGVTAVTSTWMVLVAAVPSIVIVTPLVLAFRHLEVVVSASGVTVRYGLNGWPRQHINLGDILRASVDHVGWRSTGGLGYRGSLRICKEARVVVRHGQCLRLDLVRGRRFWITVDEPQQAVASLADLGVDG